MLLAVGDPLTAVFPVSIGCIPLALLQHGEKRLGPDDLVGLPPPRAIAMSRSICSGRSVPASRVSMQPGHITSTRAGCASCTKSPTIVW